MEEYKEFIEASLEANLYIYKKVLSPCKSFYQPHSIGAGGDISIGIDLIAEEIFIKALQKFGKIDSEESGLVGEGEYQITIDPLDGSDNFKSNIPYFGSSIALQKENQVKVAIVTNLANGVAFIKTDSIFVSSQLGSSIYKKVIPNRYASVGIFERAYRSKKYADKLKNSGLKYRSLGAVALSLAYTNQVQFFIYEGEMRSYDVKAGLFINQELYQHKEKDLTIICQQINHFKKLKNLLIG